MLYRGYFTAEGLLTEVGALFPCVVRPPDALLTQRGDEDCCCRYLREAMQKYVRPALPLDGVRYLSGELAELSEPGMRWLLPSLLRVLLVHENIANDISLRLIWDLSQPDENLALLRLRYGWLSACQTACLQSVLEYCAERYGHEVARAQSALVMLHD